MKHAKRVKERNADYSSKSKTEKSNGGSRSLYAKIIIKIQISRINLFRNDLKRKNLTI